MAKSALGCNGVLTIGQAVKHIKDLTADLSASELDDTTRDDGQWGSTTQGRKKWAIDFTLVVKQGDTMYAALLASFENDTEIANANAVDEFSHAIGGKCKCVKFTRSEPDDGVVTCAVRLVGRGKPALT